MWLLYGDAARAREVRRGRRRVLAAQQLANALEREALLGVAADVEQLLQVLPGVVRGAGLAERTIDQSQLDVVADRAAIDAGQLRQLVEGVARVGDGLRHGYILRQCNCHKQVAL